jgi:hypothetical protein
MRNQLVLGILALGLFTAFTPPATAQTNSAPAAADDLVTRSGTVYHHFHIEKVDPTSLLISYKLSDGGMGITRVDFADLPENLQSQYGYDPKNTPTPADPHAPPVHVAPPAPAQKVVPVGS